MHSALAVLAAVAVVAVAVPAGGAVHGTTIEGSVTGEDGEPADAAYVLVQPAAADRLERATNGSRPVVRSLLELAASPPRVLTVNTTTTDGGYTVHVDSPGDYDIVAVTEDGRVSDLRSVRVAYEASNVDLELDEDGVQRLEGSNAAGTPGGTTTVAVTVPNTDDEPVRNLTVAVDGLPAGWTVASVETDGTYDAASNTVRWDRVEPGANATATLTVSVPEDAATRTYAVGVVAGADSHFVEHVADPRVRVSRADSTKTPAATPTPLGGDSIEVPDRTATPDRPAGGPLVPLLSVGVFSMGVAVAAYAVGRTGVPVVGHQE